LAGSAVLSGQWEHAHQLLPPGAPLLVPMERARAARAAGDSQAMELALKEAVEQGSLLPAVAAIWR
jgi:hypothetical protein